MQIWLSSLLLCTVSGDVSWSSNLFHPFTQTASGEVELIGDEIYASSTSKKGVFQELNKPYLNIEVIPNNSQTYYNHLSLLIYPTNIDSCTSECGIIQRITRDGHLKTPQLYTNSRYQLLLLIYSDFQGNVFTFSKTIKPYTWQEVIVSFATSQIRLCVRSIFDAHCHIFLQSVYRYSINGPWTIGGSAHRLGMPGLIKNVKLITPHTPLYKSYQDEQLIRKPLLHFVSPLQLHTAETFYICKAYEVDKHKSLSSLTDAEFYTEKRHIYSPDFGSCDPSYDELIELSKRRRLIREINLVYQHLYKPFNCTELTLPQTWLKRRVRKMDLSDVSSELRITGNQLILSKSCRGLAMLLLSSCHGNVDAVFSIAALLKSGTILPQNEKLADELIYIAASQKSILANMALANQHPLLPCPMLYAYHGVVADDYIMAWKSSNSEDIISDRIRLKYGDLGIHVGENDQVFQFLLMQAQQGNADAQANVGRMYYWGQGGIERNVEEAFVMQQAAANQNHPDALFDTAVMLLKGHGVTKNVTKARYNLEKAAKLGHKGALGSLGYLELNENNNVTGAVHYFNKSHQLGDTDATHNLAVIQSFYSPFHDDPLYAHKMFKIAAERGHKDAAHISAEQCLHGVEGQSPDCKLALRYLKLLSEHNHQVTRKMREGSKLYQSGDITGAALRYLILAEAGIEMAQYNLAWLCQEYSTSIEYEIPYCVDRYFTKSALQGYGPSQIYLANTLFKRGDYYRAARLYGDAVNNSIAEGLHGLGNIAFNGYPVNRIVINGTSYYFGSTPNLTLTRTLWKECFYMGAEDSIIGCGISLAMLFFSNLSAVNVIVTITLYIATVAMLSKTLTFIAG